MSKSHGLIAGLCLSIAKRLCFRWHLISDWGQSCDTGYQWQGNTLRRVALTAAPSGMADHAG